MVRVFKRIIGCRGYGLNFIRLWVIGDRIYRVIIVIKMRDLGSGLVGIKVLFLCESRFMCDNNYRTIWTRIRYGCKV